MEGEKFKIEFAAKLNPVFVWYQLCSASMARFYLSLPERSVPACGWQWWERREKRALPQAPENTKGFQTDLW